MLKSFQRQIFIFAKKEEQQEGEDKGKQQQYYLLVVVQFKQDIFQVSWR